MSKRKVCQSRSLISQRSCKRSNERVLLCDLDPCLCTPMGPMESDSLPEVLDPFPQIIIDPPQQGRWAWFFKPRWMTRWVKWEKAFTAPGGTETTRSRPHPVCSPWSPIASSTQKLHLLALKLKLLRFRKSKEQRQDRTGCLGSGLFWGLSQCLFEVQWCYPS